MQETVLSVVVFEDGSYEGDREPVAAFKAFSLGRKLALTRLLAIFAEMERASEDQERGAEVKWFRDQVLAVSDQIDESALIQLRQEFPALDQEKKAGLRTSAEAALHGVRKALLSEIDALEKSAFDQSTFRSWLLKSRVRYQTWLSRL